MILSMCAGRQHTIVYINWDKYLIWRLYLVVINIFWTFDRPNFNILFLFYTNTKKKWQMQKIRFALAISSYNRINALSGNWARPKIILLMITNSGFCACKKYIVWKCFEWIAWQNRPWCMYLLIGKGQSAQKRPYWGENRIKRNIYE